MTSKPLVTVIIPLYNAADFVSESVKSICNQSYSALEIIVCDDASTDNSLAIVSRIQDERIRIIRNETNLGYLRTINKLFALSHGQYIAFHDADDVSHPQRIELQVGYLETHPEISLVGTNFSVIDTAGTVVHHHPRQLSDPEEIQHQLQERNVFQKPSILFHRKIWETIGGFREGFLRLKNISEDYDWLLRVSEHFSMSNVNGNEALYHYRSVASAMSKGYSHIEQGFGHKIAQHLAKERRNGQRDSLEREDWAALDSIIHALKIPYRQDRSLFYYEKTESLLYAGLNFAAVRNAFIAVTRSPFRWRNIRCFAYCIKVILYSFIKSNAQ